MPINTDKHELKTIIESCGFSNLDFKVVNIKETLDIESVKTINIIRMSSGHEQNYYMDNHSNWLTEFEDDLKHGFFGQIVI